MAIASREQADHAQRLPREGRSRDRAQKSIESADSSVYRAYERASCEYQTMIGLTATKAATARDATLRRSRACVVAYATGMVNVPLTADSDRRPISLVPKTLLQPQAAT